MGFGYWEDWCTQQTRYLYEGSRTFFSLSRFCFVCLFASPPPDSLHLRPSSSKYNASSINYLLILFFCFFPTLQQKFNKIKEKNISLLKWFLPHYATVRVKETKNYPSPPPPPPPSCHCQNVNRSLNKPYVVSGKVYTYRYLRNKNGIPFTYKASTSAYLVLPSKVLAKNSNPWISSIQTNKYVSVLNERWQSWQISEIGSPRNIGSG